MKKYAYLALVLTMVMGGAVARQSFETVKAAAQKAADEKAAEAKKIEEAQKNGTAKSTTNAKLILNAKDENPKKETTKKDGEPTEKTVITTQTQPKKQ